MPGRRGRPDEIGSGAWAQRLLRNPVPTSFPPSPRRRSERSRTSEERRLSAIRGASSPTSSGRRGRRNSIRTTLGFRRSGWWSRRTRGADDDLASNSLEPRPFRTSRSASEAPTPVRPYPLLHPSSQARPRSAPLDRPCCSRGSRPRPSQDGPAGRHRRGRRSERFLTRTSEGGARGEGGVDRVGSGRGVLAFRRRW